MKEKFRNLLVRTATGVVFVVVVLAAMLCGRVSYAVLLAVVAAGCTLEFLRLARGTVQKWLGAIYIVLCMVAMWFFPVVGADMGGVGGIIGKDSPLLSGSFNDWDVRIAPAFMIIVWANDTFAYLVGVAFGRHKMSTRLSPHKSWEGFAGGLAGATVVAAVLGKYLLGADVWLWAGFGLLVALGSVAGDFTESWFKRAAGVKDSGRLLPGHGGVLDRFDATLGAVPVAFLFFLVTYLVR